MRLGDTIQSLVVEETFKSKFKGKSFQWKPNFDSATKQKKKQKKNKNKTKKEKEMKNKQKLIFHQIKVFNP